MTAAPVSHRAGWRAEELSALRAFAVDAARIHP